LRIAESSWPRRETSSRRSWQLVDRKIFALAKPWSEWLPSHAMDSDATREVVLPSGDDHVDFDESIDAALERLPRPFLDQLGSVAIVVEDEATLEQLAAARAPGLFGLYQGVPRTQFGVDNVPIPSKITLFRGPLMRAHPTPATLTAAIEDTLLHEIAHHLGIDDDRLREIRAGAGRHG
jgi:predicted Zn-dependent protease with MMP-like domain